MDFMSETGMTSTCAMSLNVSQVKLSTVCFHGPMLIHLLLLTHAMPAVQRRQKDCLNITDSSVFASPCNLQEACFKPIMSPIASRSAKDSSAVSRTPNRKIIYRDNVTQSAQQLLFSTF